jgi:hypothetical protein
LKRKLILLNVALAALIAAAGWRLRVEWVTAKQHEGAVLGKKIPPAPRPPYQPLQAPQPVLPAQYIEVAKKDLFAKDRNDLVPIEPPPAPPPPPPMPPLPVVRGVLNIDGPTAIMSENAKAAEKEVRPGEKVGEFTLVAVNHQEIILEWKGQQVRKKVEELMDHTIRESMAPAPAAPAAPAAAQAPGPITAKAGPGADMGAGRKACAAGDSSPVGTVMDGLKKVTWETPFGTGCAWEPAK